MPLSLTLYYYQLKFWTDTIANNIGIDSRVFVLEKSIAVLAEIALVSESLSTIPNAFF